jgi:ferredoxin
MDPRKSANTRVELKDFPRPAYDSDHTDKYNFLRHVDVCTYCGICWKLVNRCSFGESCIGYFGPNLNFASRNEVIKRMQNKKIPYDHQRTLCVVCYDCQQDYKKSTTKVSMFFENFKCTHSCHLS